MKSAKKIIPAIGCCGDIFEVEVHFDCRFLMLYCAAHKNNEAYEILQLLLPNGVQQQYAKLQVAISERCLPTTDREMALKIIMATGSNQCWLWTYATRDPRTGSKKSRATPL